MGEQTLPDRLRPELKLLTEELNHELDVIMHTPRADQTVRLHASHDLAMATLRRFVTIQRVLILTSKYAVALRAYAN
jgi:hypothetical protein